MRVWRLARQPYCMDRVGLGSRDFGARWNAVGTPVLYCASSVSLAALEYLAHLADKYPKDVVLVAIDLPAHVRIETPKIDALPEDWQSPMPSPDCQSWGSTWCKNLSSLAIAVPSVIVPEERNIMLNTAHPAMAKVTLMPIRAFYFDIRLL